MLLEDPDFRLRIMHAEDMMKQRLPGLAAQQQQQQAQAAQASFLAPALSDPLFIIDPAGEAEWRKQLVRLNIAELLKHGVFNPSGSAAAKVQEGQAKAAAAGGAEDAGGTITISGLLSTSAETHVLAAIEATWPNHLTDGASAHPMGLGF